jgi:hypothetical protein
MSMRIQGIISDTSPSSASTAAGDIVSGLANFDALTIIANLVGATGGTLDVYLQTSWDGGTTWYDWAHFPQLAAGAAAINYTISAPSSGDPSPIVVGKNTTPALAANSVVGSVWGPQLRALYVAGSSTSAGAAVTITICGYQART